MLRYRVKAFSGSNGCIFGLPAAIAGILNSSFHSSSEFIEAIPLFLLLFLIFRCLNQFLTFSNEFSPLFFCMVQPAVFGPGFCNQLVCFAQTLSFLKEYIRPILLVADRFQQIPGL